MKERLGTKKRTYEGIFSILKRNFKEDLPYYFALTCVGAALIAILTGRDQEVPVTVLAIGMGTVSLFNVSSYRQRALDRDGWKSVAIAIISLAAGIWWMIN